MFFCLWKLFYNHFITFSNQVPSCQQQEQQHQQQQTRAALATTKISTTTSEKWLQKFSWHTPAAGGKGSQDEAARRMADCQDAEDNNSLSVSVVCLHSTLFLFLSLSICQQLAAATFASYWCHAGPRSEWHAAQNTTAYTTHHRHTHTYPRLWHWIFIFVRQWQKWSIIDKIKCKCSRHPITGQPKKPVQKACRVWASLATNGKRTLPWRATSTG